MQVVVLKDPVPESLRCSLLDSVVELIVNTSVFKEDAPKVSLVIALLTVKTDGMDCNLLV